VKKELEDKRSDIFSDTFSSFVSRSEEWGISPYLLERRRFYTNEGWQKLVSLLSATTTLYVGNLSFHTREEQIYELFSQCGQVKRVIMGLNKTRLTPCGFCFVEYHTHEDAVAARKFVSGTKLDEKIIRADLDCGFEEGRQFGRSKKSGGQIRNDPSGARWRGKKKDGARSKFSHATPSQPYPLPKRSSPSTTSHVNPPPHLPSSTSSFAHAATSTTSLPEEEDMSLAYGSHDRYRYGQQQFEDDEDETDGEDGGSYQGGQGGGHRGGYGGEDRCDESDHSEDENTPSASGSSRKRDALEEEIESMV
jgi:nuclear cap-binding protein subunit 2